MLGFLLTVSGGTLFAQATEGTEKPSVASENSGQEEVSYSDSDQRSAARAPLSSVPWFLKDMRNGVGFSLGISESYDHGELVSSSGQPEALRSDRLTPRLFVNRRRKYSQFFLDYSFEYSAIGPVNTNTHSGTMQFQRMMSPKVTLGFGDAVSSSRNYSAALIDPIGLGAYEQIPAVNLVAAPQRVFHNFLSTTLGYRMTRRNALTLWAGHDFWRYSDLNLGHNQGLIVGVHSTFQIKKWLYLDNTYSHYVTVVDDPLRQGQVQIHRLQIGGLRFARAGGGWEASVGGGVDVLSGGGRPEPVPSVHTGVSKIWKSGRFSLDYQRGFFNAIGAGVTALNGNSVIASFSQSLSRRVNLTLYSDYNRGKSGDSRLDYVSGNARLGFAVQRHLLLSLDYWYISQRLGNFSFNAQNLNRYTIGGGLSYTLPSLFHR